ncbi:hypothetical protein MN116_003284 [Schistosoma mekongi]|uniref:Uncharacterized protein n=1 Tax=Schistosoma mekongi TaxID=38744 RepID=A0AAE2D7D4_SCHME|nr:hypothetical protein MN116_003284 [Schistosoma mekongi]
MTATTKPRRASAKACLKAICGLTAHQDPNDSSISENIESEMSDFVVESGNNNSTTEESNSSSANEAETSSNSKISPISSPLSSVIDEPLNKSSNKAHPSILSDRGYLRSPFVRYMRFCRGRIDRDPRSIAPVRFQQGIDTLKHIFNDIRSPFLYCPRSSTLNPEIHFIVSHEWGRITDMCWIPVSPFSGINELTAKACSYGSCMITIPEVNRVLGHLIVACQDGFVRIFSIPTCPMNFGFEDSSASKFTYTLSKNCYLTLSPSMKENPHWLGWPTCVHIRCEFPDHLFVGYTTGYVCYYNVSSLNELVYSPQYNHLAPVKMSRLSNSPITTLSLHPLNGKMLYVQGLERVGGIWDLDDSLCFTSDSGEMIWNPAHGFMGREGIWINNGEFLVSSRDSWFTSTACRNNSFPKWSSLFNTMDNCISQFLPAEPNEGCSHLIPLGIQSLTSVDFSESLNALVCSTDRGRIEVIAESIEKRKCDPSRPKYIPEMRIPLCQWTMEKRPSDEVTQSVLKTDKKLEESEDLTKFDYDIVDINAFMDERKIDPFSTNITSTITAKTTTASAITNTDTNTTTTNSIAVFSSEMDSKELDDAKFRLSLFPSPNCEHCKLDHSMCWHKLWSTYQLRILLKDKVPMKPTLDFINTPMLRINKVRFNPNPTCATWIAIANSVGFIQFMCIEQLYCRSFDIALNRTPTGKDSIYLAYKPREVVLGRPANPFKKLRKKSERKPAAGTSSSSTKVSSKRPVQINTNNVGVDMTKVNINSDSSGDSSATEMMINDMHTLNIIDANESEARTQGRIRRRSKRLHAQRNISFASTSSTDPCQE